MLKKTYLKTKPECKVYFKLPKNVVNGAEEVHVVGDFNDWDEESTPMKKLKSGDFTLKLNLDVENDYEFRYLVDGKEWINEEEADGLAGTPYPDTYNSVISL